MESELELNDILQQMHIIATVPDQYRILVELNTVRSLLQLLSHENTGTCTSREGGGGGKVVQTLQVSTAVCLQMCVCICVCVSLSLRCSFVGSVYFYHSKSVRLEMAMSVCVCLKNLPLQICLQLSSHWSYLFQVWVSEAPLDRHMPGFTGKYFPCTGKK